MASSSFLGNESFLTTLARNREILDGFVEKQKALVDAQVQRHAAIVAEEEADIEGAVKALEQVQYERGLNVEQHGENEEEDVGIAKRRVELQQQQERVMKDMHGLQEQQKNKENQLHGLMKEEDKMRARAEQVRKEKQNAEEFKRMSVDDLTRGLINYKKCLGLDFEKGKDAGKMRFVYTRLEESNPLRPFSFVLNVNENDTYVVEDCEPPIDSGAVSDFVEKLNSSNDYQLFFREMRKAFVETL